MSRHTVCKFYMKGNCRFGSSCRFFHPDNQDRSSDHRYYDEYQPRNNRNVDQHYYDDEWDDSEVQNTNFSDYDKYKRNNHNNKNNYYSKRDYNTRNSHYQNNDYNRNDDYYDYGRGEDRDDYYDYDRGDGRDDYHSQKKNNVKNLYEENSSDWEKSTKSNFNYENNQHYANNYQGHSNSFGRKTENHMDIGYEHGNEKNKLLKYYEKEIKAYQTHIKQMLDSNMWPLTCFHPIGFKYPISSIGCLNLLDVSFEELRCDYYNIKNTCADAGLIHQTSVNELLLKARQQKEDVLMFTDRVKNDMLATFKKCEQSKTDLGFQNTMQTDVNSYWDMSLKKILNAQAAINKAEMDSFSFSTVKTKTEKKSSAVLPSLKILMQTDVYGKMDCEIFNQESFTDFVPIMPPPRKYCL